MAYSQRGRDTQMRADFVRHYLADPAMNATEAALAAGYGGKNKNRRSAARVAHELLKREDVKAHLAEAMAARSARTEITADMVVERLWAIATADPNELMQHRRTACRYCHGMGHAYQWIDEAEWLFACQRAEKRHQPKPSDAGGYGFSEHAEINPHCPRCNGEGHGHTFFADTRRIKGPARLLYAGVKDGRDGMEVKTHDQVAAMRDVAKLLGFFKDKVELTGKDGGPVEIETKGGVSGLLAAARQARPDADRG